jgi:adenylate cyclase
MIRFLKKLFRVEKKLPENDFPAQETMYAIPLGSQGSLPKKDSKVKKEENNQEEKIEPVTDFKMVTVDKSLISDSDEVPSSKPKFESQEMDSVSLDTKESGEPEISESMRIVPEQEPNTQESQISESQEKSAPLPINQKSLKEEQEKIKPKFSLQMKMMTVISLLLGVVVSIIIFLATYFFKKDNTLRVLETNLELVRIIELKVRADINSVVEKGKQLALVLNQDFKSEKQKTFFVEQFFKNDNDFIFLGVYELIDGEMVPKRNVYNYNYLEKVAINESEVLAVIQRNQTQFIRSFDGASVLLNTSPGFEEPTICISIPPQEESVEKYVLVIMVKLQMILDAFNKSEINETFMVDGNGVVIAHPKKEFVLSAKNLSDMPIVRSMLSSQVSNGQTRFSLDDKKYLGSYQRLKLKFSNIGILSTVLEEKAFESVYDIQEKNIYIMLISLCSAMIIVLLFAKTISKPVMKLLEETIKIARGDFQVNIKSTTNDEVGLLSDYFVNMAKGLEEREKVKSILGSMIDPVVVGEAMKDLVALKRGSEKVITAFFSDVAGFSTISEQLSSVDLASLLNEYLSAMTTILQKREGVLDKYIGDAIVGIFGAPVDVENHHLKACHASLEMIVKLKDLKEYWVRENLYSREAQEMDIRIGLNTGLAKVGFMGTDSMGSFTMMGDTVNLAARLEAAGKDYGVNILISDMVQREVAMEMYTRTLDKVRVKGKNEPVTLYELISIRSDVEPRIREATEAYEEAFKSYLNREWMKAIQMLDFSEKAKGIKDKAVSLLRDRCESYLSTPPEDNWDGVYTRTHK